MRRVLATLIVSTATIALGACGSSAGTASPATTVAAASATTAATSAAPSTLLAPAAAKAFLAAPPAGLTIIDVRTPAEFAAGHIDGAVDIDLQGASWAGEVAKLDPAKPYFVYCHSGRRSAQAVAYLAQHGFTQLTELDGGIAAWQAAGLPTVTA